MAGSAAAPVELWKDWGLHSLVLLSFTLQVMLLVAASFRRRVDSGWLRAFVWSAYMLADWTAIYALGHLSMANWPGEHHLMLLWAPFLLLHLGGQDNITAYAMEDNRLWLRHLQALAVQACAAAYVLYLSSSSSTGGGGGAAAVLRFRQASVVLYVVGVLKYVERVVALWYASSSRLGKNYISIKKPEVIFSVAEYNGLHNVMTDLTTGLHGEAKEGRKLVLLAHLLLHVPMELFLGPLSYKFQVDAVLKEFVSADKLYKVAERQLSLLHDVLYTKAPVVKDSMYGFCIRIVSGAGTAAAFVLYQQGLTQVLTLHPQDNNRNHYHYCGYRRRCSRADVAVTYVLLVGALVLEAVAVVATLCSTWTELGSPFVGEFKCRSSRVIRVCMSVRRHLYWSGTMGQHNLLELCVGSRASRWSKAAKFIGVEDWWNTLAYSGSAAVPALVEELVMELAADLSVISRGQPSSAASAAPPPFFHSSVRRQEVLRALRLGEDDAQHVCLTSSCDIDETILVWHIATDIYLRGLQGQQQRDAYAEAVQALSNYMLFLLAARPGMLLGPASRNRYVQMCYDLTNDFGRYASANDLASRLCDLGRNCQNVSTFHRGCWLGAKLTDAARGGRSIMLNLANVWVEILCYAGHRCSGYSHAGRLSNGGELVTVAAIVMEYVKRGIYKVSEV